MSAAFSRRGDAVTGALGDEPGFEVREPKTWNTSSPAAEEGILLAARAAFDTDDGVTILQRLTSDMRAQRLVLPSADTLERIGLAGRARARRVSAQAINDALDGERKRALTELLKHERALTEL